MTRLAGAKLAPSPHTPTTEANRHETIDSCSCCNPGFRRRGLRRQHRLGRPHDRRLGRGVVLGLDVFPLEHAVLALGRGLVFQLRPVQHFAELQLWKAAGIDIAQQKGPWYRDTGSGMGPTLNTASGMNAYALTDRGTWLSFRNRGNLVIAVEGDKRLFNQYGVILVNPARHPHVKAAAGQRFIDFLLSPAGQQAIADFRVEGQQLFHPDAGQPGM